MSTSNIFDRSIVKHHRDRAAKHLEKYDFLFKDSAQDLVERALFYQDSYSDILDLGCRIGYIKQFASNNLKFNNLYQTDISGKMLSKASGALKIECDEENLPFAAESFDLVVSNLNLHWVNNLGFCLKHIHTMLKNKGRFIASVIGGKSLQFLRKNFIEAEMVCNSNIGFHISPMITSESMMRLTQAVGFKEVVVDTHIVGAQYSNVLSLLQDLQKMGESNAMNGRVKYLRKDILQYLKSMMQDFQCDFEIVTVSAMA